jgi:heme/copper-type cytochrome/quinol oxidase subunit 2
MSHKKKERRGNGTPSTNPWSGLPIHFNKVLANLLIAVGVVILIVILALAVFSVVARSSHLEVNNPCVAYCTYNIK